MEWVEVKGVQIGRHEGQRYRAYYVAGCISCDMWDSTESKWIIVQRLRNEGARVTDGVALLEFMFSETPEPIPPVTRTELLMES